MRKKITQLPLIQWASSLQYPYSDIYFHNFVKQFFDLYDTALEKVIIEIQSRNLKKKTWIEKLSMRKQKKIYQKENY